MNLHLQAITRPFTRVARIGMLSVFFLAPSVFADTVTMVMTGTVNAQVLGGYYVNPYIATINGNATTVICDDFSANTYFGQQWQATETTFSTDAQLQNVLTNNPTSLRWGTAANALDRYKQVAWLSLQLLNNIGTSAQGEISYAIWKVFTPSAVIGRGFSEDQQNSITGWVNAAAAAVATPNWSSGATFSIYTPVAVPGDAYPYTYTQEFISVRTPESSAIPMLAFNFAAVLVVACLLRRRLIRSAN